jgi:hypothetical protein
VFAAVVLLESKGFMERSQTGTNRFLLSTGFILAGVNTHAREFLENPVFFLYCYFFLGLSHTLDLSQTFIGSSRQEKQSHNQGLEHLPIMFDYYAALF